MTTDAKAAFADRLNGREYGNEITAAECDEAARLGLLIVFGASDDLTEFRGVIRDEHGAGYGATVHTVVRLPARTLRVADVPEDATKLVAQGWRPPPVAFTVKAEWCPEGFDGSWRITADVPFAPFDIFEDGELYCRGAVIDAALAEERK